MKNIKKMIVNPLNQKRMSSVYVLGKGWYAWNGAYRVYNSAQNYEQLKNDEVIDFTKSLERQ
jgi:hypothetical protein